MAGSLGGPLELQDEAASSSTASSRNRPIPAPQSAASRSRAGSSTRCASSIAFRRRSAGRRSSWCPAPRPCRRHLRDDAGRAPRSWAACSPARASRSTSSTTPAAGVRASATPINRARAKAIPAHCRIESRRASGPGGSSASAPAYPTPHPGTQFPVEAFDQYTAQLVPNASDPAGGRRQHRAGARRAHRQDQAGGDDRALAVGRVWPRPGARARGQVLALINVEKKLRAGDPGRGDEDLLQGAAAVGVGRLQPGRPDRTATSAATVASRPSAPSRRPAAPPSCCCCRKPARRATATC